MEENIFKNQDFIMPYKCALDVVMRQIRKIEKELSESYGRQIICYTGSRIKSADSIVEKCIRKKCEVSIEGASERLNDIAGARIVCLFPQDVYKVRDMILEQTNWKLVKKKDFIKKPKKSGYRSLHMIFLIPVKNEFIKVEIQLRTIAMDYWIALEYEMGYKANNKKVTKKKGNVASELKACNSELIALEDRMNNVLQLFEEK